MTDQNEETVGAATEPEQSGRDEAGARAGEGDVDQQDNDGELDRGLTERQSRQARRDDRWRDRARTAEGRAERLARREVLRLLGERVTDPEAALMLSGADLADLLDDDGDVDGEAVAELAGRVAEARPYLRPAVHHGDIGPKSSLPQRRSSTWDGVIRRK
jgi:hypothetical protein